jgi:hypothetical protein
MSLAFGLPGGKSDVLIYVWRYVRVANNSSILIACRAERSPVHRFLHGPNYRREGLHFPGAGLDEIYAIKLSWSISSRAADLTVPSLY